MKISDFYTAALLRLTFIFALFLLNLLCFIRMFCVNLFSLGPKNKTCVHTATCGFILLLNSVYLSSWLPYLFHAFYNSTIWPLMQIKDHCVIQHSVSGQVATFLLAVLCVIKLYEAFSPKRAKALSFVIIITWIVPQLIYSTIAEIMNVDDNNNIQLLDNIQQNENENKNNSLNQSVCKDAGFVICVHKLTGGVIAQLSWHYVVLVIPLTAIILISLATNHIRHSFTNEFEQKGHCKCPTDNIISICLYFNFLWLLFLRPLLVLRTIKLQNDHQFADDHVFTDNTWNQPFLFYLDVGNHLIIVFTSILVPFSTHGGLRTSVEKRLPMKQHYNNFESGTIKTIEALYNEEEINLYDSKVGKEVKVTTTYNTNTL